MTDSVTLTAAELKLVVLFSKHLETPKVDWEAISKEGEFAHANSARCTWNSLKTKKFNHKPNSRKRKIGDDGDGDGETRTTKKAGAGRRKAPKDVEQADRSGVDVKEEVV